MVEGLLQHLVESRQTGMKVRTFLFTLAACSLVSQRNRISAIRAWTLARYSNTCTENRLSHAHSYFAPGAPTAVNALAVYDRQFGATTCPCNGRCIAVAGRAYYTCRI